MHRVCTMPDVTKLQTVEDRDAAALEKLRQMGIRVPEKDAWKKTVGWARECTHFDEAMRLGAEWRAEVNRESLEEFDRRDADS